MNSPPLPTLDEFKFRYSVARRNNVIYQILALFANNGDMMKPYSYFNVAWRREPGGGTPARAKKDGASPSPVRTNPLNAQFHLSHRWINR